MPAKSEISENRDRHTIEIAEDLFDSLMDMRRRLLTVDGATGEEISEAMYEVLRDWNRTVGTALRLDLSKSFDR